MTVPIVIQTPQDLWIGGLEKIFPYILDHCAQCDKKDKIALQSEFEKNYTSFENRVLEISNSSIETAKQTNKKWHNAVSDKWVKTVEGVVSKNPRIQRQFENLEKNCKGVFVRQPRPLSLREAARRIFGNVKFDTIRELEDENLAKVVELGTKLDKVSCTNNPLGSLAKSLLVYLRCVTLASVEMLYRMRRPDDQSGEFFRGLLQHAQEFMKSNIENKPEECQDPFETSRDSGRPGIPFVMTMLGLMSNPLCLTPKWTNKVDPVIREALAIDLAKSGSDPNFRLGSIESRVDPILSLLVGLAVHNAYISTHPNLKPEQRNLIESALTNTKTRISDILNELKLEDRDQLVLRYLKQWLPDKVHPQIETKGWGKILTPDTIRLCYEHPQVDEVESSQTLIASSGRKSLSPRDRMQSTNSQPVRQSSSRARTASTLGTAFTTAGSTDLVSAVRKQSQMDDVRNAQGTLMSPRGHILSTPRGRTQSINSQPVRQSSSRARTASTLGTAVTTAGSTDLVSAVRKQSQMDDVRNSQGTLMSPRGHNLSTPRGRMHSTKSQTFRQSSSRARSVSTGGTKGSTGLVGATGTIGVNSLYSEFNGELNRWYDLKDKLDMLEHYWTPSSDIFLQKIAVDAIQELRDHCSGQETRNMGLAGTSKLMAIFLEGATKMEWKDGCAKFSCQDVPGVELVISKVGEDYDVRLNSAGSPRTKTHTESLANVVEKHFLILEGARWNRHENISSRLSGGLAPVIELDEAETRNISRRI